jgi:prepilin-type N-terminal cleavage/methylation domain-containing protein
MNQCRSDRGTLVRRQDGFTIIELLIASVIMVVALVSIASVLPTANMTIHQSGQATKAISLAQEMVEMIKNDPFSDLTLYNNVDSRTTSTYPVDSAILTPGNPSNYLGGSNVTKWKNDINLYLVSGAGITNGYGTITVAGVAQDAGGNDILRRVTVTVYWTERGQNKSVTLATLASKI